MATATLTDGQAALLREVADNDGVIFIGDWCDPFDKKAARALVRTGMLSVGDSRGSGYHHITAHGREWLAQPG